MSKWSKVFVEATGTLVVRGVKGYMTEADMQEAVAEAFGCDVARVMVTEPRWHDHHDGLAASISFALRPPR